MLTVDSIDLSYGASQILRKVSLTAKKGEVTCVLGRNGVGKTSLIRGIFGLQPIKAGHILWEGKPIDRMPAHKRAAAGLALVPQGREIFPRLTVLENLKTGLAAAKGAKTIPDEIFELFPVLDKMLHRRGGDLSGGQQQQLSIARALVTRPTCLVLTSRPRAFSPRSSRTSAASSRCWPSAATWRSCWSNNIWISPASWPTVSRSWSAARS